MDNNNNRPEWHTVGAEEIDVATGLAIKEVDNETPFSVVLHVDLDCFYAAVEHVRLGIPREKPLAVQQWRGLIAINYAARAAGITRHERVDQALKKCPELQLVHVETIGEDGGSIDTPNQVQAKVSLERYRQASASVFSIFRRFSDVYEKASIDEAYLDVTEKVEEMVKQGCNWGDELQRLTEENVHEVAPMIVLDGPLMPFNSCDRRMLAGAIIADKIRTSVRDELGYTCSVGIATNKLLAKIASAKNKPDRQTLVPPRAIPDLMETMPLRKMRLLGGKLGEELTQKWGFSTAGEAQALSLAALVSCFGDRMGAYVWHAVRGIQADKVQAKQMPKSMLAAKSFGPTNDLSDIRRWLSILAEELSVRMLRDFQQNHRQPRLLQLYYRSGDFKHSKDHSKSWSIPHSVLTLLSSSTASSQPPSESIQDKDHLAEDAEQSMLDFASEAPTVREVQEQHRSHGNNTPVEDISDDQSEGLGLVVTEKSKALAKLLHDAAYSMFKRLEGTFPCSRLALAASSFQDLGAQGTRSIQHFFSNTGAGSTLVNKASSKSLTPEKSQGKMKGILRYLMHQGGSVRSEEVNCDTLSLSNSVTDKAPLSTKVRILVDEPTEKGSSHHQAETSAANLCSGGALEDSDGGLGNRLDDNCLSQIQDRGTIKMTTQSHEPTKNGSCDGSYENSLTVEPSINNLGRNKSLCNKKQDGIELGKVDLKEQLQILADIQRSIEQPIKSDKPVRRRGIINSTKRPRQSSSLGGQQSIGKFFHTQAKPLSDG